MYLFSIGLDCHDLVSGSTFCGYFTILAHFFIVINMHCSGCFSFVFVGDDFGNILFEHRPIIKSIA